MRSYGLDPGTRGAGGIRTRDPSSVKLAVYIHTFGLCVENMNDARVCVPCVRGAP